jgi:hypothetical protein
MEPFDRTVVVSEEVAIDVDVSELLPENHLVAMPTPRATNGIARLERIADIALPPLGPAPINPSVYEAMQAWMAMARAYGSIVTRQHEFEHATIDVLKELSRAVEDLRSASTIDLAETTPSDSLAAALASGLSIDDPDESPTDPRG